MHYQTYFTYSPKYFPHHSTQLFKIFLTPFHTFFKIFTTSFNIIFHNISTSFNFLFESFSNIFNIFYTFIIHYFFTSFDESFLLSFSLFTKFVFKEILRWITYFCFTNILYLFIYFFIYLFQLIFFTYSTISYTCFYTNIIRLLDKVPPLANIGYCCIQF